MFVFYVYFYMHTVPNKKNTQKCMIPLYINQIFKKKKYDVQECVNFKFLLLHVNKILCVMRLKPGQSNVHKYTHTHTHTHTHIFSLYSTLKNVSITLLIMHLPLALPLYYYHILEFSSIHVQLGLKKHLLNQLYYLDYSNINYAL